MTQIRLHFIFQVFCRTWTTVDPVKYYNPVSSLLLDNKEEWQGMKTVAQLRREKKMAIPQNPDSEYRDIERAPRRFNPLKIPTGLQKTLPFASKPKLLKKRASTKPTLEQRRAVVMDSQQKKEHTLMQHVKTVRNSKIAKRKEGQARRKVEHLKRKAKADAKYEKGVKFHKKRRATIRERDGHVKQSRYSDHHRN